MADLATILVLLLGYPFIVLLVAITGPHSEFEKAEYRRFKAERRQSKDQSNG